MFPEVDDPVVTVEVVDDDVTVLTMEMGAATLKSEHFPDTKPYPT